MDLTLVIVSIVEIFAHTLNGSNFCPELVSFVFSVFCKLGAVVIHRVNYYPTICFTFSLNYRNLIL